MTDNELNREDDHLRVLIETLQREGRSEHEIETAVLQASSRAKRDASATSRHLIRFALARRARTLADASR
jgi:hypothetical protein